MRCGKHAENKKPPTRITLNLIYIYFCSLCSALCDFVLQFFGALSMGLLIYFTRDFLTFTLVPICVSTMLTLCSMIFLVSSTINWKTSGKIRMARINFVSAFSFSYINHINNKNSSHIQGHMRKQHAHIFVILISRCPSINECGCVCVCVRRHVRLCVCEC